MKDNTGLKAGIAEFKKKTKICGNCHRAVGSVECQDCHETPLFCAGCDAFLHQNANTRTHTRTSLVTAPASAAAAAGGGGKRKAKGKESDKGGLKKRQAWAVAGAGAGAATDAAAVDDDDDDEEEDGNATDEMDLPAINEYFVAFDGNDANDGSAKETPFKTFGRAVQACNAVGSIHHSDAVKLVILTNIVEAMPAKEKTCVVKFNNPHCSITVVGDLRDSSTKAPAKLTFRSELAVDQLEVSGKEVIFENIAFVIDYPTMTQKSAEQYNSRDDWDDEDQLFDCIDAAILVSAKKFGCTDCSFSVDGHAKILVLNLLANAKKTCHALFEGCAFKQMEQAIRAGTFLHGDDEEAVKANSGSVHVTLTSSVFEGIDDMAVQVRAVNHYSQRAFF